MSASSSSDPVFILIKAKNCGACIGLDRVWKNCEDTIRKNFPRLRLVIITLSSMQEPINEKLYPSKLKYIRSWFPMMVLIPGPVWDHAMSNLGVNNPVDVTQGIQIMNGEYDRNAGRTNQVAKYPNFKDPAVISAWLKEASSNREFLSIQNNYRQGLKSAIKPTVQPVTNAVQQTASTSGRSTASGRRIVPVPSNPSNTCAFKLINTRPRK